MNLDELKALKPGDKIYADITNFGALTTMEFEVMTSEDSGGLKLRRQDWRDPIWDTYHGWLEWIGKFHKTEFRHKR